MIMAEPVSRMAPKGQDAPADAAAPASVDEMTLVKRARKGDLVAYDELVRRSEDVV